MTREQLAIRNAAQQALQNAISAMAMAANSIRQSITSTAAFEDLEIQCFETVASACETGAVQFEKMAQSFAGKNNIYAQQLLSEFRRPNHFPSHN